MAAAPQVPGWALGVVYYHSNVSASGAVAAAREITVGNIPAHVNVSLDLSLKGQADLAVISPTYTFATPVLGGQLTLGVASWFGQSSGSLAGTLTATAGSIVATRSGVISDTLTSYGDVVPTATLRWNQGVNNYMVYVTGDIPAGDYIRCGLPTSASATARSMPAAPIPISIRRPETNFRPPPASPTISGTRIRNTGTASISTSTGRRALRLEAGFHRRCRICVSADYR